jgi:hypothetical protein
MIPPSFPSCFRKHRSTLRRAPSPSMERQCLSAVGHHTLAHGNIALRPQPDRELSLLCFCFCLLSRNWDICRTPIHRYTYTTPGICGAATHATGVNHNKSYCFGIVAAAASCLSLRNSHHIDSYLVPPLHSTAPPYNPLAPPGVHGVSQMGPVAFSSPSPFAQSVRLTVKCAIIMNTCAAIIIHRNPRTELTWLYGYSTHHYNTPPLL